MNKFTTNLIVAVSVISISLASALAFSSADTGKQIQNNEISQVDIMGNVAAN
jgi:hypothetical protein